VPILDRIPSKPDPIRQTKFSVAAVVEDLKPRSYTWQCNLWLDQQQEGACVGHAWTHEAAAKPVPVTAYPRPNFTAADPQAFAFELYDWCRRNDEWDGEDYDGTSVAAGAKGMTLAGGLLEYRWTHDADELAVAVSRKGPCVIGVDWYTKMMRPDAGGIIHAAGRVEGGHCILVNGYSVAARRFRLHNSWGPGWGAKGEALLSHDDMALLMASNGEGCLPIRRHL
jgi:hypothetical protein